MIRGVLRKMATEYADPIRYFARVGDERLRIDDHLGQRIQLRYLGEIRCVECGQPTRKSFSQGHCWPCSRRLASCDECIVKPELCHFAAGTCREPEWGLANCMQPHTVYLANSSGAKVGITRGRDPIGRWIDQGAAQGLAVREVSSRLESGQVEAAVRQFVTDRTNWRTLLRGEPEPIDLAAHWAKLEEQLAAGRSEPLPGLAIAGQGPVTLRYPVLEWPAKIRSIDLLREPVVEGTLLGVKGQWWLLDIGHLQIRKHTGFVVELSLSRAA